MEKPIPDKFIINGGHCLEGEIRIGGAKNAAVAIIPATILAGDVCRLENLPNISDVAVISKILQELYDKDNLSKEQLTLEYVQNLIDRISALEENSSAVNRKEILQLNAELDAILSVLKQQ